MATAITECGDLYCQHQCYSRTLTTRVVSCKRSEGDREYGPYQVLLADTVLFPEGGGQVSITVLVLYLLAIPKEF